MAFDVQGARQAGYSDREIADYLAPLSKFDAERARASGYSDAEIVNYLSNLDTKPVTQPSAPVQQPTAQPQQREASWREVFREALPQIGARIELGRAGAQEYIGETREQAARRRFWQATILPDAIRRAQANKRSAQGGEYEGLWNDPAVLDAAKRAGMRVDQFARDWPEYANKTPEELEQIRREAIETMRSAQLMQEDAQSRRQMAMQVAAEGRPRMDDWSAKSLAFDALVNIPNLLASVGASVAGGPVAGIGVLGATVAPQFYAEARERGADHRRAEAYAALMTLAEAVPETPVFEAVARTPAGKNIIRKVVGEKLAESGAGKVAGTAAIEGISEMVTEALQIGIDAGMFDEKVSLREALERIARSGVVGTGMGAAVATPSAAIESVAARRSRQQEQPSQDEGPSDEVLDAVAERFRIEPRPGLPPPPPPMPDVQPSLRSPPDFTVSSEGQTVPRGQRPPQPGDEDFTVTPQGYVAPSGQQQPALPHRPEPTTGTLRVDPQGRVTPETQKQRREVEAEVQRRRELGLDEVANVNQRGRAVQAEQASARPDTPQNVELYQFRRTPRELRGRRVEVRPLTEAEFEQFVKPVLSDGTANTLDEYLAQYPNATHIRLVHGSRGVALDQVGNLDRIRPSGPNVRRVASFDEPESQQFGQELAQEEQREEPRRSTSGVDTENDSLLTAIAKLGGLSREEAAARGVDPAHFSHRGYRLNLTFRRSGRSFDEMAEVLHELGYPVTDARGNYDPHVLHDLIDRELAGNKVFSISNSSIFDQLEERGRSAPFAMEPTEAPTERPVAAEDLIQLYESYPELVSTLEATDRLHEHDYYPSDFDTEARSLADLGELAMQIDEDAAMDALESAPSDVEAAARLWQIIKGAKNASSTEAAGARQGQPAPSRELPAAERQQEQASAEAASSRVLRERDLFGADVAQTEALSRENARIARALGEGRKPVPADQAPRGDLFREATERELEAERARQIDIEQAQAAIDQAADAAATSPNNDLPLPSREQMEAENYKVGDPIRLHGHTIRVENPKGSFRTNYSINAVREAYKQQLGKKARAHLQASIEAYESGDAKQAVDELKAAAEVAKEGLSGTSQLQTLAQRTWANRMPAHYGRILGTTAPDGDHIDVFLGPQAADESLPVFVVDTNKLGSSTLDEYKVMLGYESEQAAREAFEAAYDAGFAQRIFRAITPMSPEQFGDWLENGDHKKPASEYRAKAESEPARERPQPSKNTIFTEEAAEKAREILRRKLGQLNIGIDPEIMQAGITLAGYHIEKGARTFAAYSKAMLQDLGEIVRPYLKSWYMAVRFDPRAAPFANEMDSAAEVEAADVDAVTAEEPRTEAPSTEETNASILKEVEQAMAEGIGNAMLIKWAKGRRGDAKAAIAEFEGLLEKNGWERDGRAWVGPLGRIMLFSQGELSSPIVQFEPAKPKDPNVLDEFVHELANGAGYKSIGEARREYRKLIGRELTDADLKAVDETLEQAVVLAARQIVSEGRSPEATFDALVELYNRQPRLGTRTSTSVENQAYSTPAPLAYLASRLAGITSASTVHEPTAGNGMLLIAANPERTRANEINPDRAEALRRQGFKVTEKDAAAGHVFDLRSKADVVIANPPFGVARDETGGSKVFQTVLPDGMRFETTEIDHQIAFLALDSMKANGSAVLIVGGLNKLKKTREARSDGYNGAAKRKFYYFLYRNYNVVDHFTVAGELYEKQGAGWPVDVIVIRGRGKSSRSLPAVDVPEVYSDWESLKPLLNKRYGTEARSLDASAEPEQNRARGGAVQPESGARQGDVPVSSRGAGAADGGSVGRSGSGRAGVRGEPQRPGTVDLFGDTDASRSDRQPSGVEQSARSRAAGVPGTAAQPQREEAAGNVVGAATDRRGREQSAQPAARLGGPADESVGQAPYNPTSKVGAVGTLVPINMRTAIHDSLAALEEEVGSLDEYVAKELGYDVETIGDYFSAEQIDSIALALHQFKRERGFIIGDQTGIGKGRVVAAIIRWTLRNGMVPIFITEKPNLYADMYRDLTDIGQKDIRPLMTNAGESIMLDEDGKRFLRSPGSKTHNANLEKMAQALDLGDYNMIFTTYSQLQTVKGERTVRMDFVEAFARNGIVIMDEAHNAGGNDSGRQTRRQKEEGTTKTGRAAFARQLVGSAKGVFYSSATYAKRPSVMDLYFKTDMVLAVNGDPSKLPAAIQAGGVPLQQVVAAMLTKAGQYIRRERSFAGVEYNTPTVNVDRESADKIAEVMYAIKQFDDIKKAAVEALKEQMKAEASLVTEDGSTGAAGAESTNFTSIMHNLIDQMLLGLKADKAADMAIEALKNGEKPVITVANTMGSFIGEYAEDVGLKPGDAIALSFKDLLLRYLERSREVTIKDAAGSKMRRRLTDAELGPSGVRFFNDVQKKIQGMDRLADVPISPIDWMHYRIRSAGYTSDEITGRNQIIEYREGGRAVYRTRPSSATSANGRRKVILSFNSGMTDVVILNQAGSTGLSLHASVKFKDQRRRHMIIAQAEKNIDTHMQMLGRVHRTGQVVAPRYSQMVADIPAEKRPAAVLAKKMASLNANTTAARSSQFTSKESLDFLNIYGDRAVASLMNDMDEIHRRLGSPLKLASSGDGLEVEDAARKVTGRLAMLPVAMQEEIFELIETGYREEVARADALGENVLEAKTLELDARTISRIRLFEGKGSSPFEEAAYLEIVDVKRLGKPYTSAQVRELVSKAVGGSKDSTLAELQLAGRKKQEELIRETLSEFETYRTNFERSLFETGADDRVRVGKLTMLDGQKEIWHDVMRAVAPGASFRMFLQDGTIMHGIVTEVRRKKGVKLPVATGSWVITFAVADGARTLSLPVSRLVISSGVAADDTKVRLQFAKTDQLGQPIEKLFDDGQTQSREERAMITGNLLAGYSQVRRGQITHYTTSDGRVQQGVLLPRTFDLEAFAEQQPIVLNDAQVVQFLRKVPNGIVESPDGALEIVNFREDYAIRTPRSKSEGGRYFLNADLRKAVGGDFVSVGNWMRAVVNESQLRAALKVLRDMGVELLTSSYKDEAKAIGGRPVINVTPERVNQPKGTDKNDPGISMHLREPDSDSESLERRMAAFRAKHSLESLQAHVDDIASRWTGVEGLTISVINNEYELPIRVLNVLTERGVLGMVAGLMDSRTGTAYLMRDNLASLNELEAVLFHEVEGHLSIRQFFGDQITSFLNRVAMVDPQGVREIGIEYGFYTPDGKPAGGNEKLARLASADEYLGRLAERVNSARPSLRRLWDYFVSHFAEWARKLGWKTLRLTESEIRGWLIRAQRSLRGKKARHVREAARASAAMAEEASSGAPTPDQIRAAGPDIALSLRSRASWDAPEDSRIDDLIYALQDKHVDLKRVQEEIRKATSMEGLPENIDAYMKEELYHGRVSARLNKFLNEELRPFLQRLKLAGVSLEEMEQYLWARHAPERNAYIAQINPDLPDGGSGMTNDEAERYMASLSASKRAKLEQLAQLIDRMNARTRDMLVGYGLESQATIDRWSETYQHYVPLHREGMETELSVGQGFSVRGPSTKRAIGSRRRVVNIIANIAAQRELAIVRGEKNRVANAVIGLALANPNPGFWRVIDPRIGSKLKVDPNSKTVLSARIPDENGNIIERRLVFNPHNERARRMARALKNLDLDNLGFVLSMSARVTRYIASMSTQYNPVFGIINLIRDVQAALLNLTSTVLDGSQRQIMRDTLSALRGIYIDAREARAGRQPKSEWAQLWEEFQLVGGQTGYRDLFRTSDERAKQIEAEFRAMAAGRALSSFHAVRDWLSDFNLAMENAVRLATYKAGKENHRLSNERAASIAKNITVNFNRRGQIGPQAGALYAFFNANVQGTARILETLAGPKGKKIIFGGLLLGVGQALMLAAAGFDDDDIPEYVKERNFIIPLPGTDKKYLMVPMPLGFNMLPTTGRVLTELALDGFRRAGERVTSLFVALLEAFNPLGSAASPLQLVTPTPVDPLAALSENKDWTGKPIYLENFDSLDPRPGHARAKDSATTPSIVASRIINELTGGSEYVPGLLSPTPDQIDYLIAQAFGGVGRETKKAVSTLESLASGQLPPAHRVPLFGRFFGDAGDRTSYSARFYELVKQANRHRREIEGRARNGEDWLSYVVENPEASGAEGLIQAANLVSQMRTEQRRAEAEGRTEDARRLGISIGTIMKEAVEKARDMEKRAN